MHRHIQANFGSLLVIIVIIAVLVFAWLSHQRFAQSVRPTPSAITDSAITETLHRCKLTIQNGHIPTSISDMLRREHYANRIVDGWSNELILTIHTTDNRMYLCRVSSKGPDGQLNTHDDVSREEHFALP